MVEIHAKAAKHGHKPKRPKVDTGMEIEQLTRQLFKASVEKWCVENVEEKVDKDVKGNAVDNLTALFGSAIETVVASATDCYLDSALVEEDSDPDDDQEDDDDDDDDDDDEDE
jgi:hypothetical protein